MNILRDIQTAVKLTSKIRKARKAGADAIQIRAVRQVPLVSLKPAWLNTIEGRLTWKLGPEINRAMMEVFEGFPHEVQRQLEFTPEGPGAWADRARFWQRKLKPALPPKSYHVVMVLFCHWYAHCLRMRMEAAV